MPNKLIKEIKELSANVKILYVEDEKDARLEMTDVLSSIFDDVLVAVDGLDAIEKYRNNSNIDLMITDIKMPNINGIELIKEMKQQLCGSLVTNHTIDIIQTD